MPTELPFQLQVTYTDLDGARAMRVLTQVQPVTNNRAEAETRTFVIFCSQYTPLRPGARFTNILQLSYDKIYLRVVLVLVYKSFHRFAPPYLSHDCQLVTDVGRRHL